MSDLVPYTESRWWNVRKGNHNFAWFVRNATIYWSDRHGWVYGAQSDDPVDEAVASRAGIWLGPSQQPHPILHAIYSPVRWLTWTLLHLARPNQRPLGVVPITGETA